MFDTYQAAPVEGAALRLTTPSALDPARPSILERMAAVIIRKSKDGQPTHVTDLEHAGFTGGQIAAHMPAASRMATETVVRDIHADIDGYDRNSRVALGARIITGMLPDAGQMHVALRQAGFPSPEVGDLWPEIIAHAAEAFDERTGRAFPGQAGRK
jgi:hypothetical protein